MTCHKSAWLKQMFRPCCCLCQQSPSISPIRSRCRSSHACKVQRRHMYVLELRGARAVLQAATSSAAQHAEYPSPQPKFGRRRFPVSNLLQLRTMTEIPAPLPAPLPQHRDHCPYAGHTGWVVTSVALAIASLMTLLDLPQTKML